MAKRDYKIFFVEKYSSYREKSALYRLNNQSTIKSIFNLSQKKYSGFELCKITSIDLRSGDKQADADLYCIDHCS